MNKLSILVVFCLSAAGAAQTGYDYGNVTDGYSTPPPGTDAYELNVLGTYTITYASLIMGMTAADDAISFVDGNDTSEKLYFADPGDMSFAAEFNLSWSTAEPFGVAFHSNEPYVNDCLDGLIRYGFDFSSSFSNPFGVSGRGMDSDGTYIWEVSGGGTTDPKVGRFSTGGSGFQSWDLPGITTQMSGMTLYPITSSTGIAVTTYDLAATDHYVWFFEFDGSQCTLLGSAELPSNILTTGLAYSSYTETWFVAYFDDGWKVSEFEVIETSLQRDSWGSIKTRF